MTNFLVLVAVVGFIGVDCASIKYEFGREKSEEELCGGKKWCEPDIIKEYGWGKNQPVQSATGYRSGHATTTHSCDSIRAVPSHLTWLTRYNYYRKYTEAYGIPVVSSYYVSDEALKRACFILRFLYADRADLRESMYKNFGRFGVIGVNEGTTSIPEHSHLPSWWNQRARGLGAMVGVPISTGGEENLRCLSTDRYRGDDIFFHEASHSVAELAIRSGYAPANNFYPRLQAAYNSAKYAGRWARTYAIDTVREYFAEGAQSFHNCHIEGTNPTNGIHGTVNTRAELRSYDPTLYNLLSEIWPCRNTYPCNCGAPTQLRMNCDGSNPITSAPVTHGPTGQPTQPPTNAPPSGCNGDLNASCSSWANSGYCTNSQYKDWMEKNCCKSCGCKDNNQYCSSWARNGECSKNPDYMKTNCKKSCNTC